MKSIKDITPNETNRTYTIHIAWSDGETTDYLTSPMSDAEYEECMYNTQSDWFNFLLTNDSYTKLV